MFKECKIIREKMCKINRQSLNHNIEQAFDKNTFFDICIWGGGVHLINALIYNKNYIELKDYNE